MKLDTPKIVAGVITTVAGLAVTAWFPPVNEFAKHIARDTLAPPMAIPTWLEIVQLGAIAVLVSSVFILSRRGRRHYYELKGRTFQLQAQLHQLLAANPTESQRHNALASHAYATTIRALLISKKQTPELLDSITQLIHHTLPNTNRPQINENCPLGSDNISKLIAELKRYNSKNKGTALEAATAKLALIHEAMSPIQK